MNTERDELAFELFNGDNYHQPREVNAADWAESDASDAQRCNIMFYKIMATAALKAGYRKQAPSE